MIAYRALTATVVYIPDAWSVLYASVKAGEWAKDVSNKFLLWRVGQSVNKSMVRLPTIGEYPLLPASAEIVPA